VKNRFGGRLREKPVLEATTLKIRFLRPYLENPVFGGRHLEKPVFRGPHLENPVFQLT